MYVKKLALRNFRNYEFCSVDFSPGTNVLYGHNGIGKTNILESVYFLSYARSHRGAPENELIRFGQERADISSLISFEKSEKKLEISLFKNKKKRISVNRVAINKTSGLLDYLNVVMFCPENLRIVKGSPGERRKTVDMGLCRYGKKYFKTMYGYSSVLEQRNKLLKEKPDSDSLEIWTEQLASYGAALCAQRKNYIDRLSEYAAKVHKDICGEDLRLSYKCGINIGEYSEQRFLEELNRNLEKDKRFGVTVYGCHRDDFKIFINEYDTKAYASQGQQRTAAISIKMAELKMLADFYGEMPVLLLDDVLSELDEYRQEYILKSINDAQVIITCTDTGKFSGMEGVNMINAEKL